VNLAQANKIALRSLPALQELRRYSWKTFQSDLVAGLTVATFAVPQAIAYATLAGLPPQVGLNTAIVTTTVGALFDSSRQLINGPTNALAIALMSTFATHGVGDPAERIRVATIMALMMGTIQFLVAAIRLGDLTRFISHSVVLGFTVGSGVLLAMDQLINLAHPKGFGHAEEIPIVRLWHAFSASPSLDPWHVGIALATAVLTLYFAHFRKKTGILIPDLLLGMGLVILATQIFTLSDHGLVFVRAAEGGLPSMAFPEVRMEDARFFKSALIIGILGVLEAISMSKSIASETRQKLDLNQQCLAEGAANLAGSLFGGMPGSGSLSRSTVNQQCGGKTQWSGVISAVIVAIFALFGKDLIAAIPKATLVGVLLVTAWRLANQKLLSVHFKTTKVDAVIIAATALACILISVELSILIGMALSFLTFVMRASRIRCIEIVRTQKGFLKGRESAGPAHPHPQIPIFSLEGELFFGAAQDLEKHLEGIEKRCLGTKTAKGSKAVILRMKYAMHPDAVSAEILSHFIQRMTVKDVPVFFCGISNELFSVMEKSGLLQLLPVGRFFLRGKTPWGSTEEAWQAAIQHVEAHGTGGAPVRNLAA